MRQLITFELGDNKLGIDIMAVREIRAWSPATPLPNARDYVRGIVNLRGVVLPVIDLRHRLGWACTEPSERSVIIVVKIGDRMQGLIVDAVSDILKLDSSDVQAATDLGEGDSAAYLEGIITVDDLLIMILSLERLLESDPMLAEAA